MESAIRRATLAGTAVALILGVSGVVLAQSLGQGRDETTNGCSGGNGADMTQCQHMMSSQQRDATVGNGANRGAAVEPGGIGANGLSGSINDRSTGGGTTGATTNNNPLGQGAGSNNGNGTGNRNSPSSNVGSGTSNGTSSGTTTGGSSNGSTGNGAGSGGSSSN